MKLQRLLATIGVGVLLFAASDVMTYAATGSSLVMGRVNQASGVTTIQNTSTGSALRLITQAATTPPMVVNGTGKVVHLYADRAATADNASKLGGQTITQVRTGINASTVGGKTVAQIVSSATPHVAGVIWVAATGGQFTSVSAALASINNNDAAHRYVIKVAPGTYTEAAPVAMKNYVDVEGSGQAVTTITCACVSAISPSSMGTPAVFMVSGPSMHVGLRDLTITNTGGDLDYANGIVVYNTGAGDVDLHDLTVAVNSNRFASGIVLNNAIVAVTNATVTAATTASSMYLSVGVRSFQSTTTLNNVVATATSGGADGEGVDVLDGSVLIRDSQLAGTYSVFKWSGTVRILNTVVDGNTFAVGAAACTGVLTASLTNYTCL